MRLPADIRISVRIGEQPTHRIELIRQPAGKRYWIRRDGTSSKRMNEATITQVCDKLRRWLS